MKVALPALLALGALPFSEKVVPLKPMEQAVKSLAVALSQLRSGAYDACTVVSSGLFPSASKLPVDLNVLRGLIDRHEEPLYAYMGKRCEAKDLLDDISISQAAVVQHRLANCVAMASFMAVADHDPARIPRIIRSLGPDHWEVSLYNTQGQLRNVQVNRGMLNELQAMGVSLNMGYEWPDVLSAAVEILRQEDPNHSTRTSLNGALNFEQLAALYGPQVEHGGFHVKPRFKNNQMELLLQEVLRVYNNAGILDPEGYVNRPAVFSVATDPMSNDATLGPFHTGHAYELLAVRKNDANKVEVVLRNPYLTRGNRLDEMSITHQVVVTHRDLERIYKKYQVIDLEHAFLRHATVPNQPERV